VQTVKTGKTWDEGTRQWRCGRRDEICQTESKCPLSRDSLDLAFKNAIMDLDKRVSLVRNDGANTVIICYLYECLLAMSEV
jgi:hypothetical protein